MRICVFCGASPGRTPAYAALAREVGAGLATRGIGVVYGGGRVGLMGTLADAALAAGGEVVGVIPRRLVDRELAHPALTELDVVDTLHERKARMAELADGFIALPGRARHARGARRGRLVGAAASCIASRSGCSARTATGTGCSRGWTGRWRTGSSRPTIGRSSPSMPTCPRSSSASTAGCRPAPAGRPRLGA